MDRDLEQLQQARWASLDVNGCTYGQGLGQLLRVGWMLLPGLVREHCRLGRSGDAVLQADACGVLCCWALARVCSNIMLGSGYPARAVCVLCMHGVTCIEKCPAELLRVTGAYPLQH